MVRGGGGTAILNGAGMSKYQGDKNRGEQLPGRGGALSHRLRAKKATRQRYQEPEYTKNHRSIQEGRVRRTRDVEEPMTVYSPRGLQGPACRTRATKGRQAYAENGGR